MKPVHHLYIHVPFCARRCTYCDFSIAVRTNVPVNEYVHAITRELESADSSAWSLDTIYLGGGTPSRLGGEGIAGVLDAVRNTAPVSAGAEITIEANPDDVNADAARQWSDAGVNRVSLGAQSFDDEVLEWMHRVHSSSQIDASVAILRDAGIENLSLDLIFALPSELQRDWIRDLESAIALAPDHVSLYGLTVEPMTPLGRRKARGEVGEAPEESYESEFLEAHGRLRAAGFDHYEVSNFARPSRRSRHNSAYWQNVPYAAIGPAAHGFTGDVRYWNESAYAAWVALIDSGRTAIAGRESLSEPNRVAERVYLGLRTIDGLLATDAEIELARPWITAGWAHVADGRITLTATGWLRLDSLAASLTLVTSP